MTKKLRVCESDSNSSTDTDSESENRDQMRIHIYAIEQKQESCSETDENLGECINDGATSV